MPKHVFNTNPIYSEKEHRKGHLPLSLKEQIREKAEDFSARKFSAQGV